MRAGFFVPPGDRHPVSGSHFFRFTCFTTEIGISAFSLLAGTFRLPRLIGVFSHGCRCVRPTFLCVTCTASRAFPHQFWRVLLVVFCLFSVVFAWMRTAFMAGGNAVVRSGFDR